MLEDFLENRKFVNMMQKHIAEILEMLMQNNVYFTIVASLDGSKFNPPLPKSVTEDFKPIISFYLSGYTFESAKLLDGTVEFEAGFGEENIGSLVSIKLEHILHIAIDKTPIFINLSIPKNEEESYFEPAEEFEEEGLDRSLQAFLSNPENENLFKK